MMRADKRWHLGKEIPISMLLAFAAQTGGAFWWAGSVNSRVDASENRISALERQVISMASTSLLGAERLVRVEVQVGAVKETVDKIEALIRQPGQAH